MLGFERMMRIAFEDETLKKGPIEIITVSLLDGQVIVVDFRA